MLIRFLKYQAVLAFGLMSFALSAQSNELLNREFWKQNPSTEEVALKIQEGNDPTEFNSNAFDPLVYALLEQADEKTLKLLLAQDGNGVNKITHDGRTYIFWASYKANLPFMKFLVEKGAATDVIDEKGLSVLNFTARSGIADKAVYDFLFAHGANAKTEKNIDGANALLLLVPSLTDFEMVHYFEDKGIDFNETDNDGSGIFSYAAKGGNVDMLNLLIKEGADYKTLDKEERSAMHFASMGMRGHKNSLEVFKYLESKGLGLNTASADGQTPFSIYAANGEDIKAIDYFLSNGANADMADNEGNTALMNAAKYNDVNILSLILDKTEEIDKANKKGETALMMAVSNNSAKAVALLLNQGASVSVVSKDGNTAVYYLVESYNAKKPKEFFEKLELLQSKSLAIDEKQAKGNTFFHLAAQQNYLELLKIANEMGLDINAKNNDGLTPLHIAALKSNSDATLKYLILNGADLNARTDFDETVYDLAKENELLTEQKIDLNFLQN